jgi:hypothetical protein
MVIEFGGAYTRGSAIVLPMAQRTLPERTARLGRPMGASGPGMAPNAVVLLLPGRGAERSTRRDSALAAAAMRPLARRLVRTARASPDGLRGPDGRGGGGARGGRGGRGGEAIAGETALLAHIVRYRYRGWNGEAAHPAADAWWAVEEVVRRYGDVPVALLGVDMGARAALRAAGHPAVASVLALAPWLPEGTRRTGGGAGEGTSAVAGAETGTGDGDDAQVRAGAGGAAGREVDEEPVRQLVGRHVLFVQGTNDERTEPELSYRLARRVKKVNADVCRFEVHSDGHGLRQHRSEVAALASDFVLGTLCGRRFTRPVTDALAAPPPLGLRMPLAAGFGQGV